MKLVIVTGMSGAGKSSVLKMLEDIGFFCVDNLPIPLLPQLAELTFGKNQTIEKAALGIDIRNGQSLDQMEDVLSQLFNMGFEPEIVFLEAAAEVLVKRYKETRRSHPLAGNERVDKGIELEREKLAFLKKKADIIIDSSRLLIRELKAEIDKIFVDHIPYQNFFITILSFGFKYGLPSDSDLVFDVRFLPNPYYLPELKYKTGCDSDVYEFVMQTKEANEFLNKLEDMLRFLVPNYITEGKNQLVVSIGCTGGKHRSVSLARAITERLQNTEYGLKVEHRDMEK